MLRQLQLHRQIVLNLTTHYLEPLEGTFERLNFIAALRDSSTQLYRHDRLEAAYGAVAVNEALAKSHEELFNRLLELPLAQQEQEFQSCLNSWPGGPQQALSQFDQLIQSWIPPDVPLYLKDLFCSNLRALRELQDARSSRSRSGG